MNNDVTPTVDDVRAWMFKLRRAAGIDTVVRVLMRYAPRVEDVRIEDRILLMADIDAMLLAIDGSNAFVRH